MFNPNCLSRCKPMNDVQLAQCSQLEEQCYYNSQLIGLDSKHTHMHTFISSKWPLEALFEKHENACELF